VVLASEVVGGIVITDEKGKERSRAFIKQSMREIGQGYLCEGQFKKMTAMQAFSYMFAHLEASLGFKLPKSVVTAQVPRTEASIEGSWQSDEIRPSFFRLPNNEI